jgi:DNA-binding LacI/PurR family transcriptional regulator
VGATPFAGWSDHVRLDGGYVRSAHKQGYFEAIAGKSVVAFRRENTMRCYWQIALASCKATTKSLDGDLGQQSKYLKAFRARLVDGILLFQSRKTTNCAASQKKPVVFVGRVLQGDVAVNDITAGTRMGVERLLGRGHKRMGSLTVGSSTSAQMSRLTGWRLALHARGLPAHAECHVSCTLSAAGAREASVKLLKSSPRATAIFSDHLLLVTCISAGVTPEDISCPGNRGHELRRRGVA